MKFLSISTFFMIFLIAFMVGGLANADQALDTIQPFNQISIELYENEQPIALKNYQLHQLDEEIFMALVVEPNRYPDFSVKVKFILLDAARKPIRDARFSLSFDMVYMFHGWTDVEVVNLGKGRYQAALDFNMYGLWALDTYIQLESEEGWRSVPIVIGLLPPDVEEES